nr:unnamed protein product [Digitaria exilis]
METRPDRIECPEPPEQPEPADPGRVFDTERVVTPRDALEHGGSRGDDGVVDETYDTRVKIAEALEGSSRAIGDKDKPVKPSDAAAIRAAEASAIGGAAMIHDPRRGRRTGAGRGGVQRQRRARRGHGHHDRRPAWEATMKLPTGKAVTSEVAPAAAEAANDPRGKTNPRGVSAALDMAAKHNSEHDRAT